VASVAGGNISAGSGAERSPENERSTHYFWGLMHFALGDDAITEMQQTQPRDVFEICRSSSNRCCSTASPGLVAGEIPTTAAACRPSA
jgi:hypothetical protein